MPYGVVRSWQRAGCSADPANCPRAQVPAHLQLDRRACALAIAKPLPHGRQRARQRNHGAVLDKDARKPFQQGRRLRGAGGDHARHQPLQQGVEKVRGFWGKALLDGLRCEGRACNGSGLCPISVGGAGIAGSAEDHHWGEGTACAFALALDEACFSCEGVGFVFEDLSEGVLDLCCQVGSVAHGVWSVPLLWLKLMPMTRGA
jgi:hypothetical protein